MDDVIIINKLPVWDAGFNAEKWNAKFMQTNVILNSDVYEAVYPLHWGPLSLKFAFNGCEYYETENCRYRVTDGSFLLFNHDQLYTSSVVSDKAVRSFTINFCPEFRMKKFADMMTCDSKLLDDPDYEPIKELNFFSKLYSYDSEVATKIFELKSYIDGLNYNSLYINEKLSNILEGMYKLNCKVLKDTEGITAEKYSTRVELYKRLTRAKDYIDSNFMKEVSLETLGKVSSMNQFHFLRKFKQFYNKTPHQYLTEVRLTEAGTLLKNSKHTVTDVCMEVGFDSPASFSKLFKKNFGVSPVDYKS